MNELLGSEPEKMPVDKNIIWDRLIGLVGGAAESSSNVDPKHLQNYSRSKQQMSESMIERLRAHDVSLALKILDKNPSELHTRYAEILRGEEHGSKH